MRRAIVLIITLSFAALALIGPSHSEGVAARRAARATQRGEWFFVAVLRSDGVVVPFATYWQGFWLTPWPAPDGYPAEVNTVAHLPRAWFTSYEEFTPDWYAGGLRMAGKVKLRASRLVEVENHCGKNWGLLTDYAGEKYGRNEHHRNAGIALSAPVEIAPPTKLDAAARDLGRLRSLVRRRFEADEGAWLARPDFARWAKLFPAAAAERAKRAPAITTLYRVEASGGRRFYYFEAERSYPKPRGAHDAGCEMVSAMTGVFFETRGGAPRLAERQFALSDCDRKGLSRSVPLGLIRDGRREFLIMEEHGYEDESYTIIELLSRTFRRLRQVEGGGC